jgi:hypothetical protein
VKNIFLEEKKKKIAELPSPEDQLKVIWQWVKQEKILFKEFKNLLDYLYDKKKKTCLLSEYDSFIDEQKNCGKDEI